MSGTTDIWVIKKDLRSHKVVEAEDLMTKDLAEGQIVMKVDRFAMTSNNISYAADIVKRLGLGEDDLVVLDQVDGDVDLVVTRREQHAVETVVLEEGRDVEPLPALLLDRLIGVLILRDRKQIAMGLAERVPDVVKHGDEPLFGIVTEPNR